MVTSYRSNSSVPERAAVLRLPHPDYPGLKVSLKVALDSAYWPSQYKNLFPNFIPNDLICE